MVPPGNVPTPIGSGATLSAFLGVGSHTILLAVSDGVCIASDEVEVQIITASEAIEDLINLVNASDIAAKNKRPFIASLKAAGASFDRGSFNSACGQLGAFQNKTRAQVGKAYPEIAAQWIQMAQTIQDAVGCK
jgi:hypothetical protein